ncbi:MAG: heparan N-sulfatase, partial [bacterium]|nr:heparan N-sulfatase [bacterium]
CKSNNYDSGARIPLAVRWGAKIKGGREVEDFVSMVDIGPTIMHLAGLKLPTEMTGRSLQPIFASDASGIVTDNRNFVLHGKERHVPGQEENLGGYPSRAIRTHDFLYIRNFEPQRWPAGTPDHTKAAFKNVWLADCDGGPTKRYMVEHKDDNDQLKKLYDLSFGKRPAEELYDLKADPDQMNNVAGDPKYKAKLSELSGKLMGELKATSDPRVVGGGEKFDEYPYLGGGPKFPGKR